MISALYKGLLVSQGIMGQGLVLVTVQMSQKQARLCEYKDNIMKGSCSPVGYGDGFEVYGFLFKTLWHRPCVART